MIERRVLIGRQQAELIQETHREVVDAEQKLRLVLEAVLAGHNLRGIEVVRLEIDDPVPALVIRNADDEDATKVEPPLVGELIIAEPDAK